MNKKQFDKIRNENPFLPLSDGVHELLLQNIISFRQNHLAHQLLLYEQICLTPYKT